MRRVLLEVGVHSLHYVIQMDYQIGVPIGAHVFVIEAHGVHQLMDYRSFVYTASAQG